MHRMILTLAAASLLAACSDVPSAPHSALRPGAASFDRGDPPPPPLSGDGLAEFDAFVGDDSQNACTANDSFNFAYQYFINKNGNNAFLHIRVDGRGLDVSIHQTNKKVDAKGSIKGPGFSFDIANAVGGGIVSEENGLPPTVLLQLTGKLTTEEGQTCTANATLTAHLIQEGGEP